MFHCRTSIYISINLWGVLFLSILYTGNILLAQPQSLPRDQQPIHIQPIRQEFQTPQGLPMPQPEILSGHILLPLKRTSPEQLEQALRQVCGHRFVKEGEYQYLFSVRQDTIRRQCVLCVETPNNQVNLTGDKQLCDQVYRLISAIDRDLIQGKERQIIPYTHIKPDVLMQALNIYRNQQPKQRNPQHQALPTPTTETASRRYTSPNGVRQVNYQYEGGVNNGAMTLPDTEVAGYPAQDPSTIQLADDLFQFLILPQLEAVVVEGDGARLTRIKEMISQLEELSRLNKPMVEVIYLKHVNNVSLASVDASGRPAGVIAQFLTALLETTPGNVRIVPMVVPNALILIGWGEQLETVRELIKSLDQPITAEHSRIHFFKLQHIPVQQAQTIIRGVYPNPIGPSGFMPRIALFADTRTNMLIIQADPNDIKEVERMIAEIDVASSAPKLMVKPVQLKNTLAPDIQDTLTKVIGGGTVNDKYPALELRIQSEEGQKLISSGIMTDVSIEADVRNNRLIIKSPEACLSFVEELITLLDGANPEAEIKILEIEYGDASSLVTMLKALIPSEADGSPGPQLPGAAQEEALIPIRFAVERRTNCIIAAGSPGDLKIVEALVKSLDREDLLDRKQQVYTLKSMDALSVEATITQYITNRLATQNEAVETGFLAPYEQLESAITVVAHEKSNSLIISATQKYYDEILALIKEIDRLPPQVTIKVLIAEVSLDEDQEWASELGLQDPLMFSQRAGKLLFNEGTGSPLGAGSGAPGTIGSQLISNFGAGRVGEGGYGGLVFSASSDYINIMIRALHEKRRLEVLGSPQITTMNNQRATISVGQKVPRIQGSTMSQGTVQSSIADAEVNLRLNINPNISPDGTIVMLVTLNKDKIGTEIEVGDAQMTTIDTAVLETMVSAANNQTVVLGGLITKDENKIRRKIPLLGDIPLAGKFFRQEINQTSRKELLVILTPRIIDGQEDMNEIKQMEMARMNWCLDNVVETYGDIGEYSVVAEQPYTGDAPVVMPEPIKMEDLQRIETPTLPK